jgi:Uma2 family endonuclease
MVDPAAYRPVQTLGATSGIILLSYGRGQGRFGAMATATRRLYTPEDLERTEGPRPDLVDGKLVWRDLMGQEADLVIGVIIELLRVFSRATLPGFVNGPEGGYQVFPERNRVRFPDVSFTRLDRVPGGRPAKGHSRIVPDLVVEVVSPNDRVNKLQAKLRDFRAVGVPMIWVVYPEFREVEILRPDGSSRRLGASDILDGGDALPGFSCPVAALFE